MRKRIIPGRVYSAHPISNDIKRKSESNRTVLKHQKKPTKTSNHKEDVEFSEQFLYEKWKKNQL